LADGSTGDRSRLGISDDHAIASYTSINQISLTEATAKLETLKDQFPEAETLLRFLCILYGADIPEVMFRLARRPRKYWDEHGEIAEENMMDKPLLYVSILHDENMTKKATEFLLSLGLLRLNRTSLRYPGFSIDPVLCQHIEHSMAVPERQYMKLDAVRLLCYVYPRYKEIEPL
jgi:hypothetical protein